MTLHFITGNEGKFSEAKEILPDLDRLTIDLPEIQELDSRAIIEAKLEAARQHHDGAFIVEDVAFRMRCLNGFPGPLIKWLLQSVGSEGIHRIASAYGEYGVDVVCTIGYADGDDTVFFEGALSGTIVPPRGGAKFGWDPIFVPDGHDRTFSEMTTAEKNAISHRGKALRALQEHLERRR